MAHGSEYIKIGMTTNLKQRIRNLQSGCPFKLSLWATIRTENPIGIERYLIAKFSDFNVRGEWFSLPDDEIDSLLTIVDEENIKTKERIYEMV